MNLIKNALKFTNEGKIVMKASYILNEQNLSESILQVDIRDTGVGIA